MCDRNVKSEYILIKLYAFVSEYICKRTTEFHVKIYLIAELLIFKYRRQNISVSNTALLTAVTCHL